PAGGKTMNFDPYETWLGIPPDRRPPTHYDLLGLAPYESDPAAIDQAALRRMSKVRQHQIGPHSDQSQEILSELARARLILMDPDRRTDYDAKLRARGETRPGSLVAREKVGNGDAPSDRSAPDEDAPDVLASLALTEQAVDGPASLPRAPDEGPAWWKKGLVIGPFVACDAVLIGVVLYSAFSPSSLKQKPPDSSRFDVAPPISTQKPKPSALPAPKPVVKPKPAPPPIVEPPADPPGGGDEPATPSVVTHREKDEDGDGPPGLGQASKKSVRNMKRPDLAAEDSPEQRLKGLGLQRAGSLYVLQGEQDVLKKFGEAQTSFIAYASAFDRKMEIEFRWARARQLDQEINDLDLAINARNLELERRPGRPNNIEQAYFDGLRNERDALREQRNNAENEVRRIRSQPTPPGVIQELDAEIRSCRQRCDSMVGEVRELINSTDASYDKLAKNDDVKAALTELERRSKGKLKLKLGRTLEYRQMVRRTDQLEKSLNSPATMSPAGERDKHG